jgi:hypothetical protein
MDEKDFLLKSVHDEFAKRIEEENVRQNHRLSHIEDSVKQIVQIASAVDRLATNMEHMVIEQREQSERLKALEGKDGEMWQKVVSYSITAILSIIIGFIASKMGF